jgi:hypothetical protein
LGKGVGSIKRLGGGGGGGGEENNFAIISYSMLNIIHLPKFRIATSNQRFDHIFLKKQQIYLFHGHLFVEGHFSQELQVIF